MFSGLVDLLGLWQGRLWQFLTFFHLGYSLVREEAVGIALPGRGGGDFSVLLCTGAASPQNLGTVLGVRI